MNLEQLKKFERIIERETGKEKQFFLNQLKKKIETLKEDETEFGKEVSRIKAKYFGAKKTTAKSTPKKRGRKPSTLPKKATTPEEKAQKKKKVADATGKSIDECKEILAKYEATRKAKNKAESDRLDNLEKKGDLIEGTNVKGAGAVIDDVSKDVKKKIEKEVDQFEKKAEREAKKEVSKTGKSASEVKKEVAKKVSAKTEKELSKITKEMSVKATKFIKDIQSTIAKESKDDAREFLLSVREKIDGLLSAYGCGGEIEAGIQQFETPWMGGSPSFGKGGEVNVGEKVMYNGYEYYVEGMLDDNTIILSNPKKYGEVKEYVTIEQINQLAKGGEIESISDLYDSEEASNYPYARDMVAYFIFGDREDNIIADAIRGRYSNDRADESALSEIMLNYEYNWQDNLEEIDVETVNELGDLIDYYAKGGEVKYAIVDDNSNRIYFKSTDKKLVDLKLKEFQEIYPNDKIIIEKFANGGKTRSTHSINQDRRRLSKEPHEQAYKKHRKGSYFEEGGRISSSNLEAKGFNTNSEFIGKEVSVDFRRETGIVEGFKDLGGSNYEVIIYYPHLGFTESVNTRNTEVKFLDEIKVGDKVKTKNRDGYWVDNEVTNIYTDSDGWTYYDTKRGGSYLKDQMLNIETGYPYIVDSYAKGGQIKVGDTVKPNNEISMFSHTKKAKVLGINGDTLRLEDERGKEYYAKAHLYEKINGFGKGGSVDTYGIFEGYDHGNNRPIYQVVGKGKFDDYIGEWYETKREAEKELSDLMKSI